MKKFLFFCFLFFTTSFLFSSVGIDLPWEDPIQKLYKFIQGTVRLLAPLAAITVCARMVVVQGEAIKQGLWVLLGIAGIFGASEISSHLFGVSSGFIL